MVKNKNLKKAIIGAGLIGIIHYFLHQYVQLSVMNVGIWITIISFLYLMYSDKVLK